MTVVAHPVLVGLGDANEHVSALAWAAREAASRGAPLHIVRVYEHASSGNPWEAPAERRVGSELRRAAQGLVRRAEATVHREFPGVEVTSSVVEGSPARTLVAHSSRAQLTVVGSHAYSALGAAVMGSVSTVVAARAHGPVVVVNGPAGDPAEHPAVVVGVDGSAAGHEALEFGFEVAARRGRPLHAVLAWRPDALATMQWRAEPPAPERAERWLAEELAGWCAKYPEVAVVRAVVRAHPVAALVLESSGADLLVVGARGRHARLDSLLGSVSQGVLHHAHCPVAVIHPRS